MRNPPPGTRHRTEQLPWPAPRSTALAPSPPRPPTRCPEPAYQPSSAPCHRAQARPTNAGRRTAAAASATTRAHHRPAVPANTRANVPAGTDGPRHMIISPTTAQARDITICPGGTASCGQRPAKPLATAAFQLDALLGDPDEVRARLSQDIPLRRYGEPAEFGQAAAFVLSPRRPTSPAR